MKKYNVPSEGSFSVALQERHRTAGALHWLKYEDRLSNPDIRFSELLISLSQSPKCPLICVETKEVFPDRKTFLQHCGIGIKKFKKEYDGKITVNNHDYMYVTDYLSRMYE